MSPSYKDKINSAVNKLKRRKQLKQLKDSPVASNNKMLLQKLFKRNAIVLISILLVSLIGLMFVPGVVAFFQFDFKKGDGDSRPYNDLTKSAKINIIVIALDEYDTEYKFIDGLMLLSYDKQSKELGLFAINPDLRVNISDLNRQIEIRRMLNYSLIKGKETDYLLSSLESLLAIKIDRYVYVSKQGYATMADYLPSVQLKLNRDLVDSDTLNLPKGQATNFSKGVIKPSAQQLLAIMASDVNGKDDQLDRQVNAVSQLIQDVKGVSLILRFRDLWISATNNIKTNFTKFEIASLAYDLTNVRDDMMKKSFSRSVSYYKLPSTNIYGSYLIVQERFDKDLSTIFFNINVFKEHAKIELFNASGVRGLAGNRYRWIVNMGGNVVKVGNAEEEVDEVYIYCEDPVKYTKTLDEIEKIFSGEVILKKEKYYNRQIGDIVIVIGRKYR
jgi:anionic cell wall polymer biosynthesis LytR-Cps2A-Psr (LCP) family protein